MISFKTSYILSKYEVLFLLSSIPDAEPSYPARYILSQYLSGSAAPQDAVEGLVYKKLAKKASGQVVLEPVVHLLVRSALLSEMLWIVQCADADGSELVLKAGGMFLHIRRYPHITDTWKITPYQDKETLFGEFDGRTISEVKLIGKDGKCQPLTVNNIDSWMEDSTE